MERVFASRGLLLAASALAGVAVSTPAFAAPPELVAADAWVVGPEEAYPIALSGPATVDPRVVGDKTMTLRLTFDQPLTAIRRAEATSGDASIVNFTPGSNTVEVAADGVGLVGYATVSLIDVVGQDAIASVVDTAIGVSHADFALPARVYDLDDVDAFIDAFLASDPAADMTLDGIVDLLDINLFIVGFINPNPAEPRPPIVSPIDDVSAPSGGLGRPVRFTVRDDRVFEDELVITATSSNQDVLPDSAISLVRNRGTIDLVLTGPIDGNGQTTIDVTVSNGFETTERELAATVRPDGAPIAKFTVDPFVGEAPLPVTFDARTSSDELDNIASYTWSFGDGATTTGPVASHTYAQPGSYNVTLTLFDDSGLVNQFTRVVTVAEPGFDVAAGPISRYDAKRFLWQAAFGPKEADIAYIQNFGYEAWIDFQLNIAPMTLFDPGTFQEALDNGRSFTTRPDEFFDDIAVEGPDQLRQRIAWALLQIIVMNLDQNGEDNVADSLYYSEYVKAATGNYRDLLDYVTYSFPMGVYLTYFTSSRANIATGQVPDENYAREIKQLFTIGLDQMDERGKPVLDAFGDPIPLYDNDCITEFAKVFTGLRFGGSQSTPMVPSLSDHDFRPKQLLDYPGAIPENGLIPASDGSVFSFHNDIMLALDNLFYHPNLPPFIAKQLIQRFVTSNPTGDYVQRVATAFMGGGPYGTGDRGDIAATMKAVLLDPEARDTTYAQNPSFGKPMEPYLTGLGLLRASSRVMAPAFPFPQNRIQVNVFINPQRFNQGFMKSPSVFNFYLPDFTPPESSLERGGLVSPEIQIHTSSTAFSAPNAWFAFLFSGSGYWTAVRAGAGMEPNAIIDYMVDQWYHQPLSPEIRAIIVQAINDINGERESINAAGRLLLSNPEFTILR
ncbi:MAG: DUF1800 family protein [Planctomycetota bacterium]